MCRYFDLYLFSSIPFTRSCVGTVRQNVYCRSVGLIRCIKYIYTYLLLLLYNVKRLCFIAIRPLIGCSAFHPVSVVSPLNVSQFTLELAGTLIDRQLLMFLKACNTVSVWGSDLLADSRPPRKINRLPFRIPRSLMTTWPTRWLDVGLRAPSHQFLCQTYK